MSPDPTRLQCPAVNRLSLMPAVAAGRVCRVRWCMPTWHSVTPNNYCIIPNKRRHWSALLFQLSPSNLKKNTNKPKQNISFNNKSSIFVFNQTLHSGLKINTVLKTVIIFYFCYHNSIFDHPNILIKNRINQCPATLPKD